VPHDTYGMTSLSIRQYVLGIYKQLGLREKDITKVQTGGPGQSLFVFTWELCNSLRPAQTVILAQVCLSHCLPSGMTDNLGA
jgi:Glutamate/Leucine/Phenylalanine/Valine dehydrogenase